MMDAIRRHWLEQESEQQLYFARFCELADNIVDRLILRALGVTLGPRPVEHSKNLPEGL